MHTFRFSVKNYVFHHGVKKVQENLYSPVSIQNLITKVMRTEIICHVCPMCEVMKLVEKITLMVVAPVCSIL